MRKPHRELVAEFLGDDTIQKLRDRGDLWKELNQAGIDPSKTRERIQKEVY